LSETALFKEQVDRLATSQSLHTSESLCRLLRYLAQQALEHPGVPIKEHQIATEVFGRQSDFDPHVDSMVRVQALRLRSKLAEYYTREGAGDPVFIELPKGSYALHMHVRPVTANGAPQLESRPTTSRDGSRSWTLLWAALAGAAAGILLMLAIRRPPVTSTVQAGNAATVPGPVSLFWRGFLTETSEPWVIFSNAAFVGRPDTGMRYFNAGRDAKSPILDHYTGVGEVLAVHSLDTVFDGMHQNLRVKRGSLFSLDDAKNDDLIFIGSPSENLTLLDIPSTQDFVFERVLNGPWSGRMRIVNVRPNGEEAKEFRATPQGQPLTEDYAIVALVRGINPAHSELILAGTTTIGTQAAVEFVTRENYLTELLKRLNAHQPADVSTFEAVIRVKVAKGVPVESELVALHRTDAARK
jgi:hypothetical protein